MAIFALNWTTYLCDNSQIYVLQKLIIVVWKIEPIFVYITAKLSLIKPSI